MEQAALAPTAKPMRQWSRKFSQDQIRAVLEDYRSGQYTGLQLQKKYGLGHNTLYRWVRQSKALPDPKSDPSYLASENARLRSLVVELALENRRLTQTEQ